MARRAVGPISDAYGLRKTFWKEDIEYTHRVPNGEGTFREVPRVSPKLKDGVVPVFQPGCPSYYSQNSTKRSLLSLDSKEDEFLNQAMSLSLKSDTEEGEKFKLACFEDIQANLSFILCLKPRHCSIQLNIV